MSTTVRDHLERIAADYVEVVRARTGALPSVEFEADWSSPCIVEKNVAGHSRWQPTVMSQAPDFSGLRRALECPITVDLLSYYGTFWSGPLPVEFEGNPLQLLQIWNDRDFDNLIANLIGHALEKRRIRQPLSLFFALVDDARLLSIDNADGQVMLETIGRRQTEEVAGSLSAFLAALRVDKKSPP